MNCILPVLPRLVLADGDERRRASQRMELAGRVVLLEAARADEVIATLEAAGPGVTLLDHALPGARTAELIARILEVCPAEAILVLARAPGIEFCRACMRAGAYDCIDRDSLGPAELLEVCQSAAQRVAERARLMGVTAQDAREVVQSHEREAAARLVTTELLDQWGKVEVGERTRLIAEHALLTQRLGDPAEQDAAVSALLSGLERRADAASLLVGAHIHAVGSGRLDASNGDLERAREALILGLHALATRRAPPTAEVERDAFGARANVGAVPRARPSSAWHRWMLPSGREEWMLVVEGSLLARLTVTAGAIHAEVRDGAGLAELDVSALPKGLREVELRLGMEPILNVHSVGGAA